VREGKNSELDDIRSKAHHMQGIIIATRMGIKEKNSIDGQMAARLPRIQRVISEADYTSAAD